tara:strand:- start:63 stop:326 length:264 start_codon:yes stop_codon:yes gene_type:complete
VAYLAVVAGLSNSSLRRQTTETRKRITGNERKAIAVIRQKADIYPNAASQYQRESCTPLAVAGQACLIRLQIRASRVCGKCEKLNFA